MTSRKLFLGIILFSMAVGSSSPEALGQASAPASNKPRLGVWGETVVQPTIPSHSCVRVTGVVADSPATRLKRVGDPSGTVYHMVAGTDYILSVNGQHVHSWEDLRAAIAVSGNFCEMLIYDAITGETRKYYTFLD